VSSAGSVRDCGRLGAPILKARVPLARVTERLALYAAGLGESPLDEHGQRRLREQAALWRFVHVAESQAQAEDELAAALRGTRHHMVHARSTYNPPGFEVEASRINPWTDPLVSDDEGVRYALEMTALYGTPERVAEQVAALRDAGVHHVLCQMSTGFLAHAAIMRSMELFRGIARGQDLAKGRTRLPLGHRRRVALARRVHGFLDQVHRVHVARTVGEDRVHSHAHDQLGADALRQQRIVLLDRRSPVHAQAPGAFEVDEQQADVRVDQHVAEALEHAVAVVTGEGQRVRVDHPHEAGAAALVRAVRASLGIGGGQEEQRSALDEGAIGIGEGVVHDHLDQAVGQSARAVAIL
jgi:hypothetical protein